MKKNPLPLLTVGLVRGDTNPGVGEGRWEIHHKPLITHHSFLIVLYVGVHRRIGRRLPEELKEKADLEKVTARFVVDLIIELMEIAQLDRGGFRWFVVERHQETVPFKKGFVVGEKQLVAYTYLKRFVLISFLPKGVGHPKTESEPVSVPVAGIPQFGAVPVFDLQPSYGLIKQNLRPNPDLIVVFGKEKIAAFPVGLVTACTQCQTHVFPGLEIDATLVFVVMVVAVKPERPQLRFPKKAPGRVEVVFNVQNVPASDVGRLGESCINPKEN
jgi:hypothetical protein